MGWINLALFALRSRRVRSAIIGITASVFALLALLLLVLASALGGMFSICQQSASSLSAFGTSAGASFPSGAPSQTALADIPDNYLPVYREAARKYGLAWEVLAGVGWRETKHGEGGKERTCINSSAGAQGPMQFMPSTWSTVGVDASGDGEADPCNYRDAIFSAAKYLRDGGAAPGDYRSALYQYNHAGWYVDEVLKRAEEYRAADSGESEGDSQNTRRAQRSGTGAVSPALLVPELRFPDFSGVLAALPFTETPGYCAPFSAAGLVRDVGQAVSGLGSAGTDLQIGGGPEKGRELVAAAKKYTGTPYVLGSLSECSPTSIDCDCLVARSLADIGALEGVDQAPMGPQQYLGLGQPVQEGSGLQAGDIIVYSQAGMLADVPGGHIAIATGNGGEVIHAIPPETTVSPDYREQGPVKGIRRVFGGEGSGENATGGES